jgi:alpha-L-fucosidase
MLSRTTACGLVIAGLLAAGGPGQAQTLPKPDTGGAPPSDLYDYGVMGPPATPAIVAAAGAAVSKPMAAGPVQPTWESIAQNYRTPSWFEDAKFGIFMHWGLYSAAAHHNEWYEKHMYAADREWHAANFGPQESFGYKDFIGKFTLEKWDPDAWAALFARSGARFVMPTAEHHDNFALWDSDVTRFNSVDMGPHRDVVAELGAAVRKHGMKFGVSNHGVENFTFVNPTPELDARLKAMKADLYDPAWADFYNVADRSPEAMERFLTDWVNRNYELIDKYHPDILWFDNGVNLRVLDPLKLKVAAYYYNAARARGQEVSIGAKYIAYAPSNDDTRQVGAIIDFEKVGTRSPKDIRPGPWMVDDTLTSTWGYTTGMSTSGPDAVLVKLIDTVSKGGFYLLNIAPMADGTIPQAQQDTLLAIGRWLDVNGEAIYETRPWRRFGEGGAKGYRFTARKDALYAIALEWPGEEAVIASLGSGAGKVASVRLLGHAGALAFRQDETGLHITLPDSPPAGLSHAYSFRITGAVAGKDQP